MVGVFFVYGLAFFVLGLVILVYPKKGSAFALARHIWLIAGFGLFHGVNEWIDMFIMISEPGPVMVLKLVRMITLPASFLFLVQFGTGVIVENKKKYHFLKAAPVVLFIVWAIIFAITKDPVLIGDIAARYLLCAPGTFLSALGLFLYIPQFKRTKLQGVVRNLRLAAITFIFYGVLAGLIVKKAPFFGANFLNYDMFMNTFGVPVQIFRAVCAIVMAYSTTCVLSVFRWETRESLRKSEQRFGVIAAAAPVILFVEDVYTVITFIHGKGLELLGMKAEGVLGRRISEVFPTVPQLDEDSRKALAGEEFGSTVSIDGVVFESYYSPLRDHEGEVAGVIGVALDITPKVQAQKELDDYRREMEKSARMAEVGTMSSAMAQQLDEPLAVTRLLLQRLASDLQGSAIDETVTSSLKKSLSEISKASEIVERFCSLAQVSGRTAAEPVDIYQIVKRIAAVFAQSAQRANLKITVQNVDIVPRLTISTHSLEQIFFILVQNAIDAVDVNRGDNLTISCRVEDEQVELQFSDSCGGISPEKLAHIFDPLFATEPRGEERSMRLAVAKQIACSCGGDMRVESKVGRGTMFRVILPIERANRN